LAREINDNEKNDAKEAQSIIMTLEKMGEPTVEPVGLLLARKSYLVSYSMVNVREGMSSAIFIDYLKSTVNLPKNRIKAIMDDVADKHEELENKLRHKLGLDDRWEIKDVSIRFDEYTDEVVEVVPIDWERVDAFTPEIGTKNERKRIRFTPLHNQGR